MLWIVWSQTQRYSSYVAQNFEHYKIYMGELGILQNKRKAYWHFKEGRFSAGSWMALFHNYKSEHQTIHLLVVCFDAIMSLIQIDNNK